MKKYYPEGILYESPENQLIIKNIDMLIEAANSGKIVEAYAVICDNDHNLIVDLPCITGIIPREEGAVGIDDGTARDIAVVSRVSKPVCFKIIKIERDSAGKPVKAILSRKAAQIECYTNYVNTLRIGDIINARVTHNERFGSFVDIGCGISSMIPVDFISVSRIFHPSDRFSVSQNIRAVVRSIDTERKYPRITLSHKELLGTWSENASIFSAGETAAGIIRSVENYGIFVELMPNLAGLAEFKEDIHAGQIASVYIKAIIPEKMKVKLIVAAVSDETARLREMKYFVDSDHIDYWRYSPDCCPRLIETDFAHL